MPPKRTQWAPCKDSVDVDGVAVEWSLSKDGIVQYGPKAGGKRPTFTLRKAETEIDVPRLVAEKSRQHLGKQAASGACHVRSKGLATLSVASCRRELGAPYYPVCPE